MGEILDRCRRACREVEQEKAWGERREWTRAVSQIEFAAMLLETGRVPEDAGGPAVESALDTLSQAVRGRRKRYAAAVEECLEPFRKAARSFTVHCVGHAHIDMNWMWNWPETVGTTIDTFTTVDALMDEYPEFTFAQSQASVYRILQRFAPWLLERVRNRIREGRWEVTALTWVEADKNLACGEDICRQMLLTRRFFQEILGDDAPQVRVDFEPDLFGHPRTTPTIVARGGARYMYFMRCGKGLPLFWFQGPDGSRLLAFDIGCYTGYNGVIAPEIVRFLPDFEKKTGLRDFLYLYGVGDHGGGPTRRDIENILWFQKWPVWPRFIFGTLHAYFEKVERDADKLPVVDDELNYIFEGCYTSQARIKVANRMGPALLYEAELWSTLAARLRSDFEYPTENLNRAWEYVCFNQFHDILPGSGVHETVEHARGLFQEVQAAAQAASARALRLLDREVRGLPDDAGRLARHDVPEAFSRSEGAGVGLQSDSGRVSLVCRGRGEERYFTVFNPSPWERSGLVRCRLWDTGFGRDVRLKVVNSRGTVQPVQVVGSGHYWGHEWIETIFPVQGLPGCGYGMVRVSPVAPGGEVPAAADAVVEARAGDQAYVANRWLRLELDVVNGRIASLQDRAAGRELIAEGGTALLNLLREAPHGMTAWTIGTITRDDPVLWDDVAVIANGPWEAGLRCTFRCGRSSGAIEFRMNAVSPDVAVNIEIDWLETGSRETGVPYLKLRVPLALEKAEATYTVPFGSISHPDRPQETPSIGRVTVASTTTNAAGLTLLSDSKYGFRWWRGAVEASLLRGSYDPDPHPDLGRHWMQFLLRPHGSVPPEGTIQRAAFDFMHPLLSVENYAPAGRESRDGFLAVGPQNVLVGAVKRAEDGNGIVLRLYEVEGRDAEATVLLHPRMCSGVAEAWFADVHENPIRRIGCKDGKGFLHVPVKAYGVVTILLRDPR